MAPLLPTITIRRATPADRAELERLVPLPIDGEMLVADVGTLRLAAGIVYAAVVDAAGVRRLEVTALAVHPGADGTMVADRLVAAVERIAGRQGDEAVVVAPRPLRPKAPRCRAEARRRHGRHHHAPWPPRSAGVRSLRRR